MSCHHFCLLSFFIHDVDSAVDEDPLLRIVARSIIHSVVLNLRLHLTPSSRLQFDVQDISCLPNSRVS